MAAGTGQWTENWTSTYEHTLGASLKPIYAEIIGKTIKIHLWCWQTGRNKKWLAIGTGQWTGN